MKFLREHLGVALEPHRFQHQAHDHVLRENERQRGAFAKICFYILANPMRAELIKSRNRGRSVEPSCRAIQRFIRVPRYFWPTYWKLYAAALAPDAGNRKR